MRTLRPLLPLLAALVLVACDSTAEEPVPSGPGTWSEAFDASSFGWLLSVNGTSANDLWAVGGSPDKGRIMRFDGSAWAEQAVGQGVPLLNWVYAFAPDDVMIAGNDGTILRWDGAKLTPMDTPTDQHLWGLWGASPDDVWAVGGRGMKDEDRTVLHWDGKAWTAANIPPLQRPKVSAFYKVWGSSASDVYIVGRNGAVLHWDGAALTELGVGASTDLIGVWGTGPDRVVIVGGRSGGVIARWDGKSWRTEQLPTLPGINGVWMRTPDRFHIAANQGTLVTVDFDTLETTVDAIETEVDFHGIFGDPSGRLVAVGGNFLYATGPWVGAAMERRLGSDE